MHCTVFVLIDKCKKLIIVYSLQTPILDILYTMFMLKPQSEAKTYSMKHFHIDII